MNGVLERPTGSAYGCAVCGSRDRVAMATYTKIYTPPWVYVLLLAGPIPMVIVSMIVRTTHDLTVPFCATCATRRKYAGLVSGLSAVAAMTVFLVGIIVGVNYQSVAAFVAGVLLAGVIAVAAGRYDKTSQPAYLKLDGSNVVIQDVSRGPVVLVSPVRQRQSPYPPMYRA